MPPCLATTFHSPRTHASLDGTGMLNTLKAMLFLRKECRKAAIFGLGSAGKTQAALHLAYWTKKHRFEFSVFWVPALSNATFEEAFTAMAREHPIQNSGEGDDVRKFVRRHLSSEAAGP